MKKKIGAIDPKIKAEINRWHEFLWIYWDVLDTSYFVPIYFRIDELAKRI